MRGKKSYAQLNREKRGLEQPKRVDPSISLRKRKAAIRSVVARGDAPPEAEPALIRSAELAAMRQQRVDSKQQELLSDQIDSVAEGRRILKSLTPEMAERLGRIALGDEPGFAPREQLGAMRLVAEVAGLVSNEPLRGGEDAPLNQQAIGTLRQVIAAGEARIAELQTELDALAIEGEAQPA